MPPYVSGRLLSTMVEINGERLTAFAVDASPALAVVHGVVELAPRRPDLVVSGINFGANLGTEVTVSGTVGAALEAGAFGIPGLAVSLEMDPADHLTGNDGAGYAAAAAYTRRFAEHLLTITLPQDVQAVNVNVPCDATPDTPWWLTNLSRRRYYHPTPPDRNNGRGRPGYKVMVDYDQAEADSDVWAVKVARVVAVTPLSLDLTSRTSFAALDSCLRGESAACLELGQPTVVPLASPQPAMTP
jgi:5'-nucleotidase